MCASLSTAQNHFDYSARSLNTQLDSPNISCPDEQTSIVASQSMFSAYVNKPIQTNYDTFTLGGGYNYSDSRHYSNPEIYVSRMGNESDKLRMSLMFGMYRVNSDGIQLNSQGKPYMDRRASYAGASLSYHIDEGNYFGIAVRDVYDVAYTNGDDNTFFLYEAMTPAAFANVKVFNNGFENVSVYAKYSYNSVEKSVYTLAANFESERWRFGAWTDGSVGGLARYKTDWIDMQVSYEKNISIGIIIKNIP